VDPAARVGVDPGHAPPLDLLCHPAEASEAIGSRLGAIRYTPPRAAA